MSSFHGMWSIGGLAGSAFGGFLLSFMPDTSCTVVIGVLLTILFAVVRPGLALHGGAPKERSPRRRYAYATIIIGILTALIFSAEGAVRDWSSLYLHRSLAAPLDVAGWGYSAFSAAMAICRFGGNWVRAKIGNRTVAIAYSAIATAGFAVTALSPIYQVAALGFALVGLGLSNAVPVFVSVAGKTADGAAGVTLVVTLGYASYLGSAPAPGAIAELTSLSAMVGLLGLVTLFVGLVWTAVCPRE